jgi:hypothetical protein
MKQLSRLLTAAVLVSAGVVVTQAEAISAKVQKGTAKTSLDGKTWQPVKEGSVVPEGATIQTGDSELDLYLGANGPLLQVSRNSEVVFSALNRAKGDSETIANTEVRVKKGSVLGLTTKVNAASKYQVKAGRTTASVHGAKFLVSEDGRVAVKEGVATVFYAAMAGTTGTKFNVSDRLVFEPQGNAGAGGVAAMSSEDEAEMSDRLDSMVDSLRTSYGRYMPSPQWLAVQRPFEYLNHSTPTDPAFITPGVTIPTTPGILPPFSPASPSSPGGSGEGD